MGTIDFPAYSEAVSTAADADDWFAALDERLIAIGDEVHVTRVLGIHPDGPYLWIQLACENDSEHSVVLRVNGGTTTADVLAALRSRPRSDSPFEIILVPHGS